MRPIHLSIILLCCSISFAAFSFEKSMQEAQELWNKLSKNPKNTLFERLDQIGIEWTNRPYILGPLGEGGGSTAELNLDSNPRMRLDVFDCVTFVEQSLSIALAQDKAQILPLLDSIRYKNAQVGYSTRNHFFEADWIPNNSKWVRPYRIVGDTLFGRKAIGKTQFFAKKNIEYKQGDPEVFLPFLPYKKAIDIFSKPWDGPQKVLVVAITGFKTWIWVTHTGFLFLSPGQKPLFRHASLTQKKVVEQSFADYLEGRGSQSVEGVVLLEILQPELILK